MLVENSFQLWVVGKQGWEQRQKNYEGSRCRTTDAEVCRWPLQSNPNPVAIDPFRKSVISILFIY